MDVEFSVISFGFCIVAVLESLRRWILSTIRKGGNWKALWSKARLHVRRWIPHR